MKNKEQTAERKTDPALNSLKSFRDALNEFANIENNFPRIVHFLSRTKGKVVFMGVGKSGHIGKKLAATFSSTGTPSIFVHPTEASHGDMGIIERSDTIIMLSASGSTQELLDTINYANNELIPIISITKNPASFLGKNSKFVITIPNLPEACRNNLAPTTSTLCQLAAGDAIAIALQEAKNFLPFEFKAFHPGGKLGSLLLNVEEIMIKGNDLPLASSKTLLKDVIVEMTSKQLGCCGVFSENNNKLIGIFTDGDLRRLVNNDISANLNISIEKFMNNKPYSIKSGLTANEALEFLGNKNIPNTFVVSDDGVAIGLIHVKQLA